MADAKEIERFLLNAIKHRMLDGAGTLGGVATRDGGVVEVTFHGVTDDAHVLDTISGAVLDLRLQLEVVPDLDVRIRRA